MAIAASTPSPMVFQNSQITDGTIEDSDNDYYFYDDIENDNDFDDFAEDETEFEDTDIHEVDEDEDDDYFHPASYSCSDSYDFFS